MCAELFLNGVLLGMGKDSMEGIEEGGNRGESYGGNIRHGKDEQPLLDAKGAAALLMVSESFFYRMHRAGKTPPAIKIGSLMRWKRSDLLEWIAKGCFNNSGHQNEKEECK